MLGFLVTRTIAARLNEIINGKEGLIVEDIKDTPAIIPGLRNNVSAVTMDQNSEGSRWSR